MKHRHLAALYRKIAATLRAGVTPAEAFAAIAADPGSASVRDGLMRASRAIWSGSALSAALGECVHDIPAYHCLLVAQGEPTGRADILFQGLAEIAEHDAALQDTVTRELLTPKITFACALPLVLALAFNSRGWMPVLAIALLAAFALVLAAGHLVLRLDGRSGPWLERIVMRLPHLGHTARTIAAVRFVRAVAALYSAGLLLSTAVEIAAGSCGNTDLRGKVLPAVKKMRDGVCATEALADTGVLPEGIASAIRTGSVTGNADRQLEAAATILNRDIAVSLHRFTVMLGVAAILTVGVMVGLVAISFYT